MIRVLAAIIVPPHLSASGGARAGRSLSEALAGVCDVTVASMSGVDASRPGRARTHAARTSLPPWARLLPQKYRSLFYRSDIPETVRRGGWDLVHLHNPMPALEMARIAAACRRAGIPYVVSTHGFNEVANGEAVYGFGRLRRLAWRLSVQGPVARATRGAAAVFALSPADTGIVGGFGFDGPVSIVPNGVEPADEAIEAADRQVWDRLGVLPPERTPGLTCMFLGNHTPNKGVPVLLQAFSGLRCPFQLIVGGERRDGIDYAGAIAQAGPGQAVVVTGRLADADVGALLRRTDLFVFPTLADTFPLVVLEAMAQGCAILASDVGGIPYQIEGGCGELVRPGDPGAVRDAVARLAGQPETVAAMKQAARARARTRFTWEAAAEQALEGYGRVLDARGPAAARRERAPRTQAAAAQT